MESKPTHFALIHADGTPLSHTVATTVIKNDRECGGSLDSLRYLAAPTPSPDWMEVGNRAIARYRQWVAEEFGYIQLDGLPADADLSATRLRLERLYVPPRVIISSDVEDIPGARKRKDVEPQLVGQVLQKNRHLALLASPGGGKSTLLKRLATAYAFPERRAEIEDLLPQGEWLPLCLRCRELRDRAHRPIAEILDSLPNHAGMTGAEADRFRERMQEALQTGQALLLVDGLDEISEEGARAGFSSHLRTFVAMFPQTALVVTSREAGFRLVARVLASTCVQARLAPLEQDEVRQLCEHWHIEVVGDTEKVRADARELASTIWNNERIRTLAANPLLLTTLLVVKRWIGELPRNRAALYAEAVRVLIRTWNVEGYAPMDEDETLAQLSYVACAMMDQGKQQIGYKPLVKLLQNARRELEAELQFTRIAPSDFVERIEYRSSLLMQTGHGDIDGEVQPVYEFRHLTFQEFIAARGLVQEQFPGRDAGKSLADLLEPHFSDELWREVLPLAAVLAGRKAEETVKRLINACARSRVESDVQNVHYARSEVECLCQSLLDEVQVTSPTLNEAFLEISRNRRRNDLPPNVIARLASGKFGATFQQLIESTFLSGKGEWSTHYSTAAILAYLSVTGVPEGVEVDANRIIDAILQRLTSDDRKARIEGALTFMTWAFRTGRARPRDMPSPKLSDEHIRLLREKLSSMLDPNDRPLTLAACWALAWGAETRILSTTPTKETVLALYSAWTKSEDRELARFAGWALGAQQLLDRNTFSSSDWGDCSSFPDETMLLKDPYRRPEAFAAFVVSWYRRAPWSNGELIDKMGGVMDRSWQYEMPTVIELLQGLGAAGENMLKQLRNGAKRSEDPRKTRKKRNR